MKWKEKKKKTDRKNDIKKKTKREREDECPTKKCDHVESIDLGDYKSFQAALPIGRHFYQKCLQEPGLAQVCYFQSLFLVQL